MLGWNIRVHRQPNGGGSPATFDSPRGNRVAVWQTWITGLDWVRDLVEEHHAINLGGNGYPVRFTAQSKYILPRLKHEPPEANSDWVCEAGDVIGEGWAGKTVIDFAVANECGEDEWLLIEAWDES